MTLSAAGVLSGTPTTATTYNFTVKLTDALGRSTTQALSVVVAAVPAIVQTTLPNGTVGVAYSQQLTNTGGTSPFVWTKTGTLPAGLSLSSGGLVSGTPSGVEAPSITFKVTDANGAEATQAITITIEASDYTTNMTAKYQSGNDASFALTGANVDTWIEALGGNTDKDMIFVGAGGYATKVAHRNNVGINGDKVVETLGSSDNRTRAGGTTTDFFSGAVGSITMNIRIKAVVAAFGTADCVIVSGSAELKFEVVAGPKIRISGSSRGNAEQAVSLDTWYIVRATWRSSDSKCGVTVGDNAEVLGTAGSAFPSADSRWGWFGDPGSGAYSSVCVNQVRVYNEVLSDANWATVKSTERALHAAIT
jgi:hypothetical protein